MNIHLVRSFVPRHSKELVDVGGGVGEGGVELGGLGLGGLGQVGRLEEGGLAGSAAQSQEGVNALKAEERYLNEFCTS